MRSGIIVSLMACVLVSACEEDDGGDTGATTAPTSSTTAPMTTTAGGEEEDSGDEDPSDPSTTMPATTEPATTAPSEESGGDEDPGTTTAPTEESGGAEESSTGEPIDPCEPDVSPAADACNECTKMKCCPQLQTCFDDPICVCMSGCVMGFGDFEPCAEMCGQTANFMPVTDCAAGMCLLECIG